jgi:hypothetical protein
MARRRSWPLELATLALAVALSALSPGGGADYPTDAGPALSAIAHGDLAGFLAHQPAMGAVSLYLRAPFAALAAALGDGPAGIYRWGDLPCLMSLALVSIWLSRLAVRRAGASARTANLTRALIAAVCLLNPLVHDALYWGHPEELVTASLAAGALLAGYEQRALTTGLLAGLAVASKQWALLAVAPSVLLLARGRLRALTVEVTAAGAATLPMLVGDPRAFADALRYISHPQPSVMPFTWLWPLSPAGTVHIANIFGDVRLVRTHVLLTAEALVARPLIVVLGIGVPLAVWWRRGRRAGAEVLLAAAALAFVLRCALDPGTEAYYHLPIVLVLVMHDAVRGRRVPVAGLAAAGVSFVVLDRFIAYLPLALVNAAYLAATLLGCGLLIRELWRPGTAAPNAPYPGAPAAALPPVATAAALPVLVGQT